MRKFIIVLFTAVNVGWSIPKPMESIENYNVMLIHGAYGKEKGFLDITDTTKIKEAYFATSALDNGAALGRYHENPDDKPRLLHWLTTKVFEEPEMDPADVHPKYSYVYQWRSFSNPANSSYNNAFELGDRTWYMPATKYEHRRSMMEEVQEVKAFFKVSKNGKDSLYVGQIALDSIRQNPDLYRQLASRYILVGHSMGGVVAREYVQGDFYNGDVDKVITLDSPHEGTGALNMQLAMLDASEKGGKTVTQTIALMGTLGITLAVLTDSKAAVTGVFLLASALNGLNLGVDFLVSLGLEAYESSDSLVCYVDPESSGCRNIADLQNAPYVADSMPMFRLLAGKNSMTFTDPRLKWRSALSYLIPDALTAPVANLAEQASGGGSFTVNHVNATTGLALGVLGGISLRKHGTSLVETSNGLGKNTGLLTEGFVDVKRKTFDAAYHAGKEDLATWNTVLLGYEAAFVAASFIPYEPVKLAAKAALGGVTARMLAGAMIPAAYAGIKDLSESHQMPLYAKHVGKWYSDENAFSSLGNGPSSYTPYLLEDFLYERPFVNLLLGDIHTLDTLSKMDPSAREGSTLNRNCYYLGDRDSAECAAGLFSKAGDPGSSQKLLRVASLSPLRFKSESDWSKMGVKVDRWERVDGLTPDGKLARKSVPVRHVERYEVPAIAVDDWIERYSFVVDDLMPHRLRQIRLNFNYQEEIAWECDMSKSPDADDACAVYRRTSGGEWRKLRTERHPVRKNGAFDFKPRDYGYDNLLSLQKDNQNTVTVSTVNKIGLSNTQRFYYLFKATDDLLVPVWPKRDVVVTEISGFEAYASVLDYQGFSVEGMRDSLWRLSGDSAVPLSGMRGMELSRNEGGGSVYRSGMSRDSLAEGEYHWVFNAITRNSAGESNDSNDVYDVPFHVDVTPPNFELSVDGLCMNPDSSVFIARFAWGDSTVPDIRAMRWQLEKGNGNDFSPVTAMPSLYDVTSKDFSVAWDKVPNRESLQDGLYRVKALAIDYAAPNLEAYHFATGLAAKIAGGNDKDSDWNGLDDYHFNRTEKTIEFRIDRTAPELNFEKVGGSPVDSFGVEKYAGFARPSRNQDFEYVSEDSLLQVEYSVKEPLGGRDSTAVTVAWMFVHAGDTAKADRSGDSVWVKGADGTWRGAWTEMSGMRLSDGDYLLRATVRDEAKNAKSYGYGKRVRIDRTAPKILGLVSSRLVYPDSAKGFGATLTVSERDDAPSNRTGMRCHYRVLGGDADGVFRDVAERVLSNDTVKFEIPAGAVGSENGKRYLEAVCIDAAGNAGVRTDLFHVGDRYPTIVSPASDDEYLQSEYVPIVGIAPPPSAGAENSTVYRLRYRMDGSDAWQSERIAVVSPNRSRDSANISRTSQSAEGVLGYLHNAGFSESKVWIELSTRSCADCEVAPGFRPGDARRLCRGGFLAVGRPFALHVRPGSGEGFAGRVAPPCRELRRGLLPARPCRGFEGRGHFRQDVGAGVRKSV